MKWRVFGVVLFLSVLAAAPSWAGVDQKCLSECVETGKPSSTCMPQCTVIPAKPPALHAAGDNHKVLDAPIPTGETLLPLTAAKPKAPDKDYACINQCLKDGWQYQLCETRCIKKNCGAGSQQCKDLTGAVYNPFQQK